MGNLICRWEMVWMVFTFVVKSSKGSCSGNVTIEPSSIILAGSNVSIMCTSAIKHCRPESKIDIFLDDSKKQPVQINKTTAVLKLYNVRESYGVFCYIDCFDPLQYNTICWNSLDVGYPPEKPTNLWCSSEENSSDMRCSWDKGRDTRIKTEYSVNITNLQTSKELPFTTNTYVIIPVNRSHDKEFVLLVTARNSLGWSQSDPHQVVLDDIVVPIRPEITQIEILNSLFKITIRWRNRTTANLCYCALEYKPATNQTWTWVKEDVISNPIVLFMEENTEALELRVQCREEAGKSYWSHWSEPKNISETAPVETFDVWRSLGPIYPNGSQEVTILIKRVAPDAPRGAIWGFKVFYEDKEKETVIKTCAKSQVECPVLVPMGIRVLFIAAYNSQGDSAASNVTLQQAPVSQGHQNLAITTKSPTSILVKWELPKKSNSHPCWFILQWVLDSCDGKPTNVSWQKIPKEQTQFYIKDVIKAGRTMNISLYAVYPGDVDLMYSYLGFLRESKPKRGPNANIKMNTRNKIIVEWTEIPFCEQKGLIINYSIYLTKNKSDVSTKYHSTMRYIEFTNLNLDAFYTICVTASTSAGEGPCGNILMFKHDQGFRNYTELFLAIGFGAVILIVFALTFYFKKSLRERIKVFILSRTPNWLHEVYPRVEKSIVVKSLQESKGVLDPCLSPLHSDPDIMEIQEILLQENMQQPTSLPDYDKVTKKNGTIPPNVSPPNVSPSNESPPNVSIPAEAVGYRPQISKPNFPRRDSYCSPDQMMDFQLAMLSSDNVMPKLCTNMNTLFFESGIQTNPFGFCGLDSVITTDIDRANTSDTLQAERNVSLDFIGQNLLSGEIANFPFDQHREEKSQSVP
ncbi:interleukin-12 receptor subunit beta-2-like isoform 2-T2 [Discoglossus pictus]